MSALTVKAVGMCLAQYGNKDGTNIYPGIEKVARVLETSHKTVIAALRILVEYGLLEVTHKANHRASKATVYRLSAPIGLLDMLPMLDPSETRIDPLSGGMSSPTAHDDSSPNSPVSGDGSSAFGGHVVHDQVTCRPVLGDDTSHHQALTTPRPPKGPISDQAERNPLVEESNDALTRRYAAEARAALRRAAGQ